MNTYNPVLVPVVNLPALREQTVIAAERNFDSIMQASPWMEDVQTLAFDVAMKPGAPLAKINRYRKLADKIGGAIAPFAACGSGCSHCCNIAVTLTKKEAEVIGEAIGRKPKKGTLAMGDTHGITEHFNTPCPFLQSNRCSIYEDRPMACRLHFNISQGSHICDTSIPSKETSVPNVDLTMFHAAFCMDFQGAEWGDIREFFPDGRG